MRLSYLEELHLRVEIRVVAFRFRGRSILQFHNLCDEIYVNRRGSTNSAPPTYLGLQLLHFFLQFLDLLVFRLDGGIESCATIFCLLYLGFKVGRDL